MLGVAGLEGSSSLLATANSCLFTASTHLPPMLGAAFCLGDNVLVKKSGTETEITML